MVGAEHPLPVGEGGFVQRDRLVQLPRRLIGAGEVVPASERVGMVGTEVVVGQDKYPFSNIDRRGD